MKIKQRIACTLTLHEITEKKPQISKCNALNKDEKGCSVCTCGGHTAGYFLHFEEIKNVHDLPIT